MRFEKLLPAGSVVLLKNAERKLMIIGHMHVRHLDTGADRSYDYLGVPYPEGFLESESIMLFNHSDIDDISFTGYTDKEREQYVRLMQNFIDHIPDSEDGFMEK